MLVGLGTGHLGRPFDPIHLLYIRESFLYKPGGLCGPRAAKEELKVSRCDPSLFDQFF